MFQLLKDLLPFGDRTSGPKPISKTDLGKKRRTKITQIRSDPLKRGFKKRARQSR